MAGGNDEHILPFTLAGPRLRVVMHLTEVQRGHYVRNAERAAWVARFRGAYHPYDIAPNLRGGFL